MNIEKLKVEMKKRISLGLISSIIIGFGIGLILPSASGPQDPASVNPGQTSTLLPDGRWLILGGEGPKGPLNSASIWDPRTNTTASVSGLLQYPRAWHSATLLPDGTVFVMGGVGADGQVTGIAELFDSQSQQFTSLPSSGFTPRAYHTATLLTEGYVLIAGGVSDKGKTLATAELWDARTQATQVLPAKPTAARQSHTATLLSNGTVLLWGGVDNDGNALNDGELFDPETQSFSIVQTFTPPSDSKPPHLMASIPTDGATDVPLDSLIAIRFSEPLRVETVSASTVTLTGPGGEVTAKVVPAEGGMLAFVTPATKLLPGSTYTLRISGPTDKDGFSLPETTISFTTVGNKLTDEEDWVPTAENLSGDWKIKKPESPWQSLPALQAEPGITALSGQVLLLNGQPLAGVTLQIEGRAARTDDTGRFLLVSIPPGQHVLVIDGRTANKPGKTYGVFEVGENIIEGQTNVLPYTSWMPKLDTAHAVTIPSPTTSETVVTTPRIPGLEVHIPPQTVIRDRIGQAVTSVSITPIPVDRPPFPLPAGVQVPIYFTIQPGGANIETLSDTVPHGARIIYPNYTNQPPGARENFWNYDPNGLGWYVYGQGTVTPDRKQIIPDLGVAIYKFTGAMIGSSPGPPGTGPAAGGGSFDGEPVDLGTGLFVMNKTDLFLPDTLPISLTRTYRPGDTVSRAFGIGTTHPYDIYLYSTNNYQEVDLILPDGGRVHYVRISPGTGFIDAVYEHTATPTKFYKSQIKWSGSGGWDLILKDGTVYKFSDSCGSGCPVNRLLSVTDRFGNKITITRYGVNITKITSPSGRYAEFTYDISNRITQAKDNIGRTVGYMYDASGRLMKVTDPNGGVTEYTYNASHQMLTLKDARGIVFLTNEYDTNGRVSRQTQPDSTTYQFAYTLDGSGNVTQTDVTDPRNNVRRVTFNSSGYALTDIHAVGQPEQQTITYERQAGTNLILSVTDAMNRKTAFTYDSMGNVQTIVRLSGTSEAVTTSLTYDPTYNEVTSITDPLNHVTSFTYDSHGSLIAVIDPLNHQTTLTYNTSGQPLSIADPLNHTTQFSYESGDLLGVTDPMGNTTTRFIDSGGRLLSLRNPLGNTTRYDYDVLNRLTSVTDALNGLTQFGYDPNGNLLSVTDARNNSTIYTYDNMDRLATRKDPMQVSEGYLYDADGNLQTFTDRKGQVTGLTYDALNRRSQATYAGGSSTTYTYDAGNRLTQIVDSISGTITLTYDNLDRLTQETTPQGTVNYTYDAAGRRSTMTVAGQPIVNYTYDNANRLTQISQGTSTVTFTYDAAGRRTQVALPNGLTENYTYENASRLTSIEYWNGTTLLGNLTYTYDAAGNRTQIGGTYARTGLPAALSSATYNAANRLTNWAGTTLTYDANGNLTNDGINAYTWNTRNQLSSMTGASFAYDALGRRTNKTISGVSTNFLYDGQNPVQELSGTTPMANLLTGLGVDQFLTRTDSAGTRSLLTDALGSTIALTDNTGTVQTEYTYEPFGNSTATGTANSNSFQYTGRENDGTGLYSYRARYYSPMLQRFVSEDPIEFWSGTINLYEYAEDNPARYIDPDGLQRIIPPSRWVGPVRPFRPTPPPNYRLPAPPYESQPGSVQPPSGSELIPQQPWWLRLLRLLLNPHDHEGGEPGVFGPVLPCTPPPIFPTSLGGGRKDPPPIISTCMSWS